jgi:hypothetical protein
MDINEINSNVTASNQFKFFIGGLRDEYARRAQSPVYNRSACPSARNAKHAGPICLMTDRPINMLVGTSVP